MLDNTGPEQGILETRDPSSGKFRVGRMDYLRIARIFRQERLPALRALDASPAQIEAACWLFLDETVEFHNGRWFVPHRPSRRLVKEVMAALTALETDLPG